MSKKNNSVDLLVEIYTFNKRRNQKFTQVFKYQSYLRWCSRTFEQNKKFILFSTNLDIKCNIGLPRCILKIVELVNQVSFFNKEIRKFVRGATWYRKIFIFYNRYYRYLHNEKLFGKKSL